MFGWTSWMAERVLNEKVIAELGAIIQIHDNDKRISALREYMDMHGIAECREIDVMEETYQRREEALRESLGTSGSSMTPE